MIIRRRGLVFFDSDGSAGLFSLISCCYGLCVLFVLCRCLSVLTQTLKRRRILAHRLEPCIAEADAKKKLVVGVPSRYTREKEAKPWVG